MVFSTLCSGCQVGDHTAHRYWVQPPPQGGLGGASCECPGPESCASNAGQNPLDQIRHEPEPVAEEWRDGRLVQPALSQTLCVHLVGLTDGLWCEGCAQLRLKKSGETVLGIIEDHSNVATARNTAGEWESRCTCGHLFERVFTPIIDELGDLRTSHLADVLDRHLHEVIARRFARQGATT